MTEKIWQRNTTGIATSARLRKEQKRASVDQAITALIRERKPINFHTVAEVARVSKAYLYNQADLRERIEVLEAPVYATIAACTNSSDTGQDRCQP